jgi:hypothetical protein
MNHTLLHRLYLRTTAQRFFHRLCRHLIVHVEVPLIRIYLCPPNAPFIARNSVHSRDDFNLFMSDVDFTIVTDDEDAAGQVLRKRQRLKKFLPNIGECEVFRQDEWRLKSKLDSSPLRDLWSAVYLIRKLGWQRSSLSKASTPYDLEKNQRAMGITLRKLGHTGLPLSGDALFPFLANSPKASDPSATSANSLFLGATIGTVGQDADLCFRSVDEFERFRRILPDTIGAPSLAADREVKTYLMLQELLLATVSRRIVAASGDTLRAQEITGWIKDLHKRGCPTISVALE